jgi:hypothetical protein
MFLYMDFRFRFFILRSHRLVCIDDIFLAPEIKFHQSNRNLFTCVLHYCSSSDAAMPRLRSELSALKSEKSSICAGDGIHVAEMDPSAQHRSYSTIL